MKSLTLCLITFFLLVGCIKKTETKSPENQKLTPPTNTNTRQPDPNPEQTNLTLEQRHTSSSTTYICTNKDNQKVSYNKYSYSIVIQNSSDLRCSFFITNNNSLNIQEEKSCTTQVGDFTCTVTIKPVK